MQKQCYYRLVPWVAFWILVSFNLCHQGRSDSQITCSLFSHTQWVVQRSTGDQSEELAKCCSQYLFGKSRKGRVYYHYPNRSRDYIWNECTLTLYHSTVRLKGVLEIFAVLFFFSLARRISLPYSCSLYSGSTQKLHVPMLHEAWYP